ncbi:pyridoxal phosphate-dependent aminotransferase [Lachnotalea glycerini]|nr:pyridoxal phosphate-dependent aminotransferase [Lachnotalea glycerini]
MKEQGEDVISLSVGEPDFNTPENIRKAAFEAMESGKIGYTPASGLVQLKKTICEKLAKDNHLEYDVKNIVVSNGAKHSLFNSLQAICNPGDEVIVGVPYWVSYPNLIEMSDAIPVYVEMKECDGFKFTKTALENALTEKTKAIIINSPNNPTGTVFTKEDLQVIADFAVKNDLYVISDEIYEKLIYEGEHTSIASLGDKIKELTIVVNGMSKCYAMTGWRIGYSASSEKIASIMSNIQSHATSNPNTIAQYASIEGLKGPQDSVETMRKCFEERKNYIVKAINSIDGLSCRNPEGAFYVMVNIQNFTGKHYKEKQINNSFDFSEALLENEKVAVIPGIGFGQDGYIRLSYAASIEMIQKGIERIKKFVDYLN